MTQSTSSSSIQVSSSKARCFFPDARVVLATGSVLAALLAAGVGARAQTAASVPDAAAQTESTPAAAQAKPDISLSTRKAAKVRRQKDEKVVQSKDTKTADKKAKKIGTIAGQDAKLPDKELYDKAEDAVKHGRYDVARLDLQTLLNTYPDSQYMMRAKLGVADSWFKEGGTAALTQAEQEYKDFITFFPNAPEAAEAQMRVGDIYFRQMDKPDRDYTNTTHAEEEYRLMLQQFPDSPLVPQAKQRLREVQEALASREAEIAAFYATHLNWPATIARYQTVVDTYPLYSHMDDVLLSLGDAYEVEARFVRSLKLPEAGKARLEKIYDDEAAAAYRKIVLDHSAAPHAEDARDRLAAMGLPIPTPTPEQAAASAALENSRGQYTLSNRVEFFVLHKADTIPAATIGEPPLDDAKPTLAPTITRQAIIDFNTSMNPAAYAARSAKLPQSTSAPAASGEPAATAAAPLAFQDVPTANADAGVGASAVVTSVPEASSAATSSGGSMGIQIVQPSSDSPAPAPASASPPAFPGSAPAASAPASDSTQPNDYSEELKPAATANAAPLPPVEKAAPAPDAINEVTPGSQPPAQIAPIDGKTPKPAFDKNDESSNKHKKKKGLSRLNPF